MATTQKHRRIQFWALVTFVLFAGLGCLESPQATIVGLFIVGLVEYITSTLMFIARPLQEISNLAKNSQEDRNP